MGNRMFKIVHLFCLWTAIVSCQFSDERPPLGTAVQAQTVNEPVSRPTEDLPLSIAGKNDTFAGYYCEAGDIVVGLTQTATSSDVTAVIDLVKSIDVSRYCRNRNFPNHAPEIRIATKKYSFLQLRAWRDHIATNLLAANGASMYGIGINYTRNKVVAHVDPGASQSNESLISHLGIPSDAVETVQGRVPAGDCNQPPNPTLPQCLRPMIGGIRVNGECTIGIFGRHQGKSEIGFITAGHCMPPIGEDQDDIAAQYYEYIGTESIDPPVNGIVCYGGLVCRRSDAVWVRHEAQTAQRGQIAQTLNWQGSIELSPYDPRFYVYGGGSPVEGMQVEKMGSFSGWTTGTVTDTCNDFFHDGIMFPCQVNATYVRTGGDSGAPVFFWWSNLGVNTVEVVGFHSGMEDQIFGGEISVFSSWPSVVGEFGNIDIRYTVDFEWFSSQSAHDIGVGKDGTVWITTTTPVGNDFQIKRWNASTSAWDLMPGSGLRLSVGPDGRAWMVNSEGGIYFWNGNAWVHPSGTAIDIAVGPEGSVWMVGADLTISRWSGVAWVYVSDGAVRIAVDTQGQPWIVAWDNTIWRRISATGAWVQIPGEATDIGITADGTVWVTGTDQGVFWWSGEDFVQTPGDAVEIAGGPASPWLVNSSGTIYRGL